MTTPFAPYLLELVAAAQEVYNSWEQDAEGYDEELGYGGICDRIAEAICGVLAAKGIDCGTVDSGGMGEQHVWAVALAGPNEAIWSIDIPPHVYEIGSGYVWKKRPGVEFEVEDLAISFVGNGRERFSEMLGEASLPRRIHHFLKA